MGAGNVFLLQLSDPKGSFSNGFRNIGSLFDTVPGTFTIDTTISYVGSSTHYRFRILAAVPYIISADNGSDIAIGTGPGYFYFDMGGLTGGSIGTPTTFLIPDGDLGPPGLQDQDTAFWDFGSGATPATATSITPIITGLSFSQDVTYSTTGDKMVTLSVVAPGGCSTTTLTYEIHIYDCRDPVISHDAIVINSDTTVTLGHLEPSKTYWVNPGFSLILSGGDTIFAEPGSMISNPRNGASNCVLYMKQRSVFTSSSGANSVIFGDGASINAPSGDFTLNCPTLDFDYTNAPPNPAHSLASVKDDLNSVPITLFPNPTDGMISVQGLPSGNITISVFNTLGETVMVQKIPPSPDFMLDLSKFVPGTYYIRFSSANSVVTKAIIKN